MLFVPFNSRDLRHKSHFGSSAAGESLWLSVCMPRDMKCSGVYLVCGRDGCEKDYIKLDWKSTDGLTEWWSTEYAFPEPGLYFYHFEYDTSWGRGRIFLHSAGKGYFSETGREWQQTVYDENFETPLWFQGGVMYQIFPDRFYFSGEKKKNVPSDRVMHKSFDEVPEWHENKELHRWNADFFGGDLKGIQMKLPYLKDLGVTCIYLNPIFESNSNHRYNTGDYEKIDPLLGDEKDFKNLCSEAEKEGIRIILDGVFSHTGEKLYFSGLDHLGIYFNKYNRYDSVGAYNSQSSPYYGWYNFRNWNEDYDSWWGVKSLPETNEENESFSEFITGEKGVIEKWMNATLRANTQARLEEGLKVPTGEVDRKCAEFEHEFMLMQDIYGGAGSPRIMRGDGSVPTKEQLKELEKTNILKGLRNMRQKYDPATGKLTGGLGAPDGPEDPDEL